MVAAQAEHMTEQRALLTETERLILSGEKEVKDNYRYSVESRVRTRLREQLPDDVELIRENQPEMFEILIEAVCADGSEPTDSSSGDSDSVFDDQQVSANEAVARPDSTEQVGLTDAQRDDIAEKLTGSGDLLETRVDAIEAMYRELQLLGDASRDELLAVVDPEEVRFVGGEKTTPEESSWSNLVKGKDTLSALPGVEKPPVGNQTWRYRSGNA